MLLIVYVSIMVLVVTILITVLTYTSVVFGWCGFSAGLPHPSPSRASEEKSNGSLSQYLASSFKYEKGIQNAEADLEPVECAVCLSGFNDGDTVCQLPRCKHSFHAPCIDKWLYSHSDCPLCRAPVERIDSGRKSSTSTIEENSREVLVDIRIFS